MKHVLVIHGNHENPQGNPIPYERMTQRGKFVRHDAQRYLAWVKFVQLQWQLQVKEPLPAVKNGSYRIDVLCCFKGEAHADPDNIFKGLVDAICKNCGDKHVAGSVTFTHTKTDPFVSIAFSDYLPDSAEACSACNQVRPCDCQMSGRSFSY